MLDTGSGPNIIKKNFIPKCKVVNYTNVLKLNGINEYLIYTLGKITLLFLEKKVIFHIVSNDFPIPHSGILAMIFSNRLPRK